MPLKYALYKNHLTDSPDDHHAIPQEVQSYQLEDMLEEMTVPGGVTPTQAAAVLESFMGVQEKILKQGGAINTEFYNIYPRITGKFSNANDTFDPSRHQVHFSVKMGTRFEPIPSQIQTRKVPSQVRKPQLQTYIDSASGTINQTVSPGKVGEINGLYLKVDPEDTSQGVFFISGADEYRADTYLRNTDGTLMFYIPDTLPSGDYRLEVRAIMKGTKTIRQGILAAVITTV